MSNWKTCEACGTSYMAGTRFRQLYPHECPPEWQIRSEGEVYRVRADGAEEAVETFAEKHNSHHDYIYSSVIDHGNPCEVEVRSDDSQQWEVYEIHAEQSIEWSAIPSKHRQEAGQ